MPRVLSNGVLYISTAPPPGPRPAPTPQHPSPHHHCQQQQHHGASPLTPSITPLTPNPHYKPSGKKLTPPRSKPPTPIITTIRSGPGAKVKELGSYVPYPSPRSWVVAPGIQGGPVRSAGAEDEEEVGAGATLADGPIPPWANGGGYGVPVSSSLKHATEASCPCSTVTTPRTNTGTSTPTVPASVPLLYNPANGMPISSSSPSSSSAPSTQAPTKSNIPYPIHVQNAFAACASDTPLSPLSIPNTSCDAAVTTSGVAAALSPCTNFPDAGVFNIDWLAYKVAAAAPTTSHPSTIDTELTLGLHNQQHLFAFPHHSSIGSAFHNPTSILPAANPATTLASAASALLPPPPSLAVSSPTAVPLHIESQQQTV